VSYRLSRRALVRAGAAAVAAPAVAPFVSQASPAAAATPVNRPAWTGWASTAPPVVTGRQVHHLRAPGLHDRHMGSLSDHLITQAGNATSPPGRRYLQTTPSSGAPNLATPTATGRSLNRRTGDGPLQRPPSSVKATRPTT
jgi:hypothetical protein